MSTLSPRAIEILVDLVEMKLANLEVADREDRETQRTLQRALAELKAGTARPKGRITAMPQTAPAQIAA